MENYETTIAEIDKAIADAGSRINGLANNLNRAFSVLAKAHPDGLPAAERDVLLSFEALCAESFFRTAWLFHQRHEHDHARHCLKVARMLQEAVDQATGH